MVKCLQYFERISKKKLAGDRGFVKMAEQITIREVNGINKPKFMTKFGNIVEKCPQMALHLLTHRPYVNTYEIFSALEQFFDSLTTEDKLKILLQHPELGSQTKSITEESLNEQTHAGLTVLSDESKQAFMNLNAQYRNKFGFPFIICVQGHDPSRIVSLLQERLESDVETEINRGIREVKKISKLRLSNLIID